MPSSLQQCSRQPGLDMVASKSKLKSPNHGNSLSRKMQTACRHTARNWISKRLNDQHYHSTEYVKYSEITVEKRVFKQWNQINPSQLQSADSLKAASSFPTQQRMSCERASARHQFNGKKVRIMDRRSLLAGLAFVGAAPVILSQSRSAVAATPAMPVTSFADLKTAGQFFSTVIGRAEISLATSQIAVEKATQKNAHEFAGFELGEAITVNMVLKDTGAAGPAMDAAAMEKVETIKSASKGRAFDKAYITLQLDNHEYLRDLSDAYLHNTIGSTDPAEQQGRHLAMLMNAVFKEHVAICKRISSELGA